MSHQERNSKVHLSEGGAMTEIERLKQFIKLQDLAFEVRIELLQTLQTENQQLKNRVAELERELGMRRKVIIPRSTYPHPA